MVAVPAAWLGLEATLVRKRYSTDANLAGLSHEAEDLEDVDLVPHRRSGDVRVAAARAATTSRA
ncbi:MAG: hypothetical protein U0168_21575 [Nannocystaceae bacterium]